MTSTVHTSRDPVCGMDVAIAESRYSTKDRGLTYHFCSEQCLERFTMSPALYTGPQRTADIRPIVKKRTLKFLPADSGTLNAASGKLLRMMGVSEAIPGSNCLSIEYDLRQVTLKQLETAAAGCGLALKGGLHGLRRDLWRFSESNELHNEATAGTGACCNRPPARIR